MGMKRHRRGFRQVAGRPMKKTAIVLVMLLVPLFALSSCGGKGSPWSFQTFKGELSLTAVSAADAKNVWAVGGGPIYYFNGISWKTQLESLEVEPVDVSAADANNVMACGGSENGVVFHYDGESWEKIHEVEDLLLDTVFYLDPAHAWAAGLKKDHSGSLLLFFDGEGWSVQVDAAIHIQDICATGPENGWMVVEDAEGKSAVYRFDGSSWEKAFEPADAESLYGIAALDDSHAWAVGSSAAGGGTEMYSGGTIFRFDGNSWNREYQTLEELHRVTAVDSSHVWAVGGIGKSGPVYAFDGTFWSKQFDGKEALFDVCASDATHAWAVGGLGSIFVYEPYGP